MVQRMFRGITVKTQKFNQLNKQLSSRILRVDKFGGFLLHLEELLRFALSVFPTYLAHMVLLPGSHSFAQLPSQLTFHLQ